MGYGIRLVYCPNGHPNMIPIGMTGVYCQLCQAMFKVDPINKRPVHYGTSRPPVVYRRWPRGPFDPRRRPLPRTRYMPAPTPPTMRVPADFRMLEQPPGPILGEKGPAPVTPASPVKSGIGVGGVVGIVVGVAVVATVIGAIANPEGFQDKLNSIISSVGGSSAGEVLSSGSSSKDSCAKVHEAFSYIGDCEPSSRAGYQFCYVKMRSNSGCQISNGVRLCASGEGTAFIPNECVP